MTMLEQSKPADKPQRVSQPETPKQVILRLSHRQAVVLLRELESCVANSQSPTLNRTFKAIWKNCRRAIKRTPPMNLMSNMPTKRQSRDSLERLVRQPRHRWFSAPARECEDGWYGPHGTIEAAVIECASNYGREAPMFVAQGYKITAAEREEWGAEFDWQVDAQNAIEVRLPNSKLSGEARTPNDQAH